MTNQITTSDDFRSVQARANEAETAFQRFVQSLSAGSIRAAAGGRFIPHQYELEVAAIEARIAATLAVVEFNLSAPDLEAIRTFLISELETAADAYAKAEVNTAPKPLSALDAAHLADVLSSRVAHANAAAKAEEARAAYQRLAGAIALASEAYARLILDRQRDGLPAPSASDRSSQFVTRRRTDVGPLIVPQTVRTCRTMIEDVKLTRVPPLAEPESVQSDRARLRQLEREREEYEALCAREGASAHLPQTIDLKSMGAEGVERIANERAKEPTQADRYAAARRAGFKDEHEQAAAEAE